METNFQGSLAHKLIIFTGMILWMSFASTVIAEYPSEPAHGLKLPLQPS